MKKVIFGLGILVSVLASCSKRETDEMGFNRVGASISDSFTKAHLDFVEQKQVWDADDCISVFTAKVPEGRRFTLASEEGLSTAEFVSETPLNDTTCYYAVYPASAAGTSVFSAGGDALTVNYPSTCLFDYDKYCADGCNFMVAKSEDKFFFFQNLFSYIELVVSGPDGDAVRSIEIKGNNNEIISGEAKVTFNGDGEPQVSFVSGGKSISVDFGEDGMEFSVNPFDLSVPPVLSNGFTVTVNTLKGITRSFKSAACPEFGANKILSMPEIDMNSK